MASLAAIRTGIAANLAALPGVTVTPDVVPNPTPPCAWVRPETGTIVSYHQAMVDGLNEWWLVIEAFAGAVDEATAQATFDQFAATSGTLSVKAAVESNRTLGGACSDLVVVECRNYNKYSSPEGATVIGAEWLVQVWA